MTARFRRFVGRAISPAANLAAPPVTELFLLFPPYCRGRMYAARARLPRGNVFGFVYAVPGVCRGGIYASRQGCALRGGCGMTARFRRFVGRAISPAAQCVIYNLRPGNGQRHNVRRAACMRPLQTGANMQQSVNGWRRGQDPALQCQTNNIQTANAQYPRRFVHRIQTKSWGCTLRCSPSGLTSSES